MEVSRKFEEGNFLDSKVMRIHKIYIPQSYHHEPRWWVHNRDRHMFILLLFIFDTPTAKLAIFILAFTDTCR